MSTKNKAQALAKMAADREKLEKEQAHTAHVLELLPDDLPKLPCIYAHTYPVPVTALSFSTPSYEDPINRVGVLASLERAGFTLCPASLVKWGNYRPSVHPGTQHDLPEEKPCGFGRPDKLTTSWPMAPLWIDANIHTGSELHCYMEKAGELFEINIELPRHLVTPTAHRKERKGGWHFERGTARTSRPSHWDCLGETEDTNAYACVHSESRCSVDQEQSLFCRIYFELFRHESEDFPIPASQFLADLLLEEEPGR